MTPYAGASARHVNACNLNNSLLFQFILADFFAAFEEMQRVDILCHRKPIPLPESAHQPHNQELSDQIEVILNKLIGSKRESMRLFSWNFSEGILTRLKTYCAVFAQSADNDEKELIAMQYYADKVWQHCLQAVEALRESPNQRTPLFVALEKASGATQRFAKIISRVIQQFRDDENVVFFVLRRKQQIDKLYGKRFIIKLLCRMYPKGLREARHFLTKRYMERNFDNLLPTLSAIFTELEVAGL